MVIPHFVVTYYDLISYLLINVVQYYGALDLHIDEYVILTLNSLGMPLAEPTAEMLDITTGSFIALNQYSQLYALTLLNQLQINLSHLPILSILSILPIPFKNNPQLIILITNSLVSFTMMGYYSEWSGYGSTRLADPNQRRLEYYPLSWKQIGYPGPSLGYRALRVFDFN
jgi:hypothetical protein